MKPFRIDVPDDVLDDLRTRLARTRWPDAECVDDWSQGIPLEYTRSLADYWATEYDWRARERALNRFDQFSTESMVWTYISSTSGPRTRMPFRW